MDNTVRNLVVAAVILVAFGVGTLIGQDPTCAAFFGTAALIGTVFLLLVLSVGVLID